jgi:octaprenyl-diphosphate synthase
LSAFHHMTSASRATEDENPLSALGALLRTDPEECDACILRCMESSVPLIPRLAGHLIAAGGKRIRPLLTLACARLCGYSEGGPRHIRLAAAVEFIHTATLLHDDVVDESILRRGLASANQVFGNQAAVLVGDFLFARAFQMMVEDSAPRVMAILSKAAFTLAEGEVLQLMTQHDLATSAVRYLEVIEGKTASLFAACCQIGAVVAERPDAEEQALAAFGHNLGMAFQLVDDALDYVADQAVLGKTVGDDFREGKVTFPVLHAFRTGSEAERDFWRRTIQQGTQREDDLPHALALMDKRGALHATLAKAEDFVAAARTALSFFPPSVLRDCLMDVASYTLRRGS